MPPLALATASVGVHYGPFVVNTREEIMQAIEDYQQGRLGTIPADQVGPRHFA
jgi:hypothetical protein